MYENKSSSPVLAYLGLGSNQGNRIETILKGIDAIGEAEGVCITKISGLYESDPYFLKDQNRFINSCVEIECTLSSAHLLTLIQDIEDRLGRKRTIKNGPRTLDIDILNFGTQCSDEVLLCLPHPGVLERSFVLIPLVEIAPNLVLAGHKKTVLEELAHRTYPDENLIRMEYRRP